MTSVALLDVSSGLGYAPIGGVRYLSDDRVVVAVIEPGAGKGDPGSCALTTFDSAAAGKPVLFSPTAAVGLVGNRMPTFGASGGLVMGQLTADWTIEYVDVGSGVTVDVLYPLAGLDASSARPRAATLLDAGAGLKLFAQAGIGMALISVEERTVLVRAELPSGPPNSSPSPLCEQFAAVDVRRETVYVADGREGQGGIWVYDLPTLKLRDRWLSNTRFEGLWVSPTDGSVQASPLGSNLVLSFDSGGQVQFSVPLRPFTLQFI